MVINLIISGALIAIFAWLLVDTLKRISRHDSAKAFYGFVAVLSIIGIGVGYWAAFHFEYYWSESMRIFGAPIPSAFYKLEKSGWTDFITPISTLNAFLNMVIVTLAILSPVNFLARMSGDGLRPSAPVRSELRN